MRHARRPLLALAAFALLACGAPETQTPDTTPPVAAPVVAELPPPDVSAADIEQAVGFLADDEQKGRLPGSEDDARVQAWIVERMQAAGLEAGAGDGFVQRFEVGDGVRLRDGAASRLAEGKGDVIAHALLPFGHDSGDTPVSGKLVYVDYGITAADGPGDFEGLDKSLAGAIAVVRMGSADPHVAPAKQRPQSKLIAARDRGAIGFVLWDPDSDAPLPNRGQYSDLNVPAVFVGKAGSAALRKALRARGEDMPKRGAVSRRSFELHTPLEPVTLATANVIGVLPGSAPAEQRRRIYIGAHMDHLGMGTSSSRAPGEVAVHNGADDNASGVAVILELADTLATVPADRRPHDLVFVAFGAEEMGLLGSKHLVAALGEAERGQILAMLNFDMVGRLRDRLLVNGRGTAEEWPAVFEAAGSGDLSIEGTPDGYGASDHAAFYTEGVPVLHFFTGAHDDYHTPRDDADTLNYEGAANIAELAARVSLALMEHEALTYVKVERPERPTRFRVSLGTMPDYGNEADGMALAGVSEGGPAAQAGLQKGDVVTRIGEREIHNIDDFMAVFGELEPGEAVEIEWKRGDETMRGELVPAAPRRR